MKKIRLHILCFAVWLNIVIAPVTFGNDGEISCFYLDKDKVGKQITLVRLTSISGPGVELRDSGLIHANNRICQWSWNGGSGVREEFGLDGDFAIPILDPGCESPFSHIRTGVGFGDWYLTLCGTYSNDYLTVPFLGSEYSVHKGSLNQWTEYHPGELPIEGDIPEDGVH